MCHSLIMNALLKKHWLKLGPPLIKLDSNCVLPHLAGLQMHVPLTN
jgi:hypothetical protein